MYLGFNRLCQGGTRSYILKPHSYPGYSCTLHHQRVMVCLKPHRSGQTREEKGTVCLFNVSPTSQPKFVGSASKAKLTTFSLTFHNTTHVQECMFTDSTEKHSGAATHDIISSWRSMHGNWRNNAQQCFVTYVEKFCTTGTKICEGVSNHQKYHNIAFLALRKLCIVTSMQLPYGSESCAKKISSVREYLLTHAAESTFLKRKARFN